MSTHGALIEGMATKIASVFWKLYEPGKYSETRSYSTHTYISSNEEKQEKKQIAFLYTSLLLLVPVYNSNATPY